MNAPSSLLPQAVADFLATDWWGQLFTLLCYGFSALASAWSASALGWACFKRLRERFRARRLAKRQEFLAELAYAMESRRQLALDAERASATEHGSKDDLRVPPKGGSSSRGCCAAPPKLEGNSSQCLGSF